MLEDGKPVGILDESDLLMAVQGGDEPFKDPVSRAMTTRLKTSAAGSIDRIRLRDPQ